MMAGIIERKDVAEILDELKNGENDMRVLALLANICREEEDVMGDPELIDALLEIGIDKPPSTIKSIGNFIKGYIRVSTGIRQTSHEILMKITDIEKNDYYFDDSEHLPGSGSITAEENFALHFLGPAFLEKAEPASSRNLEQEWDEAAKISFAEETNVSDDYLFSLAQWLTTLAKRCKDTLSEEHAALILHNLECISEIETDRKFSEFHVPEFLYERAGLETPDVALTL